MADYKLVDAEKLESDLTKVADAIRSERDTSGSLSFPDDFCSMLDGLKDDIANKIHNMYAFRNIVEPHETLSFVSGFVYAGMHNLKSAKFTETASYIGNYAFYNCINLELERLPDTIFFMGSYAFLGCYKITLSKIPENTTTVNMCTFQGCNAITTMLMPEVTVIQSEAFANCNGLTEVTIKKKCERINSTAFIGCSNLTTINVPWAEGEVANAPWGAVNATINYNCTEG